MKKIKQNELYDVYELDLVGSHKDRKLAININRLKNNIKGDVHIMIMNPNSKAGNHYHKYTSEFYVNPGPGLLNLYLKKEGRSNVISLSMQPISMNKMLVYKVHNFVSHLVENPNKSDNLLLFILDEDNPDDTFILDVL